MALNYLAAKRRAVSAAARGLRVTRTRVNTEAVTVYINTYTYIYARYNGGGGGRGVTRYPVIAGHLAAR